MKYLSLCALSALLLLGCSSSRRGESEEVVSTRYIHRYGYDVSKDEFESKAYPGKTVTTLRSGVTVTASYSDGVLDGETTHTFPHSHTIATRSFYDKGELVRKISHDLRGVPETEEQFLGHSHIKTIRWYQNGTPMNQEEYLGAQLMEAEYYAPNNEVEARVTQGRGMRMVRDRHGQLSLKEIMEEGRPILRETFHPHGVPHTITPLLHGQPHGQKKVYSPSGEPVSIEHYESGLLEGEASYFQNGVLYLQLHYHNGEKDGPERHFVDGEKLIEETHWVEGIRHGLSQLFFDGISRTQYFYNGQLVSAERYQELCDVEENMAIMNDRALHR